MSDFYNYESDRPYRRLLNVPIYESEVMKVPYRRLKESVVYEQIYPRIDRERISDCENSRQVSYLPHLIQLQESTELAEDEVAELHTYHQFLKERSDFEELLGRDTFKAIVMAGNYAIHPDEEDLDAVMEMDDDERQYRFGNDDVSRVGAKDYAREEMRSCLTEDEKFAIGITALRDWSLVDVSQFS